MSATYTATLAAFFDKMGVEVYGVAETSRYDKDLIALPSNVRERFPYAVTFGLVLTKGLMETVVDGPTALYQHHYRQLNYRLDMLAYLLAGEMEKMGYEALPFAASQLVDWQNQRAHISHKRVGELAGLGWLGRNNLLVHPTFGSHVRYNTVLTSMPLDAGRELEAGCASCVECLSICPAGAIAGTQADFDHVGCFAMLKRFKNERNLGHHICGLCVRACKGRR